MLFEKKMIILTGEGRGAVFIEKSGLGVKFALRTFGIRGERGLCAGVVTPGDIIVRDLPETPDPELVFFCDLPSLDALHFAVFSDRIVLYGATCKRMWESNILDLLRPRAHRPAAPPALLRPALKIGPYSDEQLAAGNFYSGLDLVPRLRQADVFLDGARALSACSSDITVGMDGEPTAEVDMDIEKTEVQSEAAAADMQPEIAASESQIEAAAIDVQTEATTAEVQPEAAAAEVQPEAAAAEVRSEEAAVMPFERIARYLRTFSAAEVKPVPCALPKPGSGRVKPLRKLSFLETSREDVEALFSHAPRDEELTGLLGGEWVKVRTNSFCLSVGRMKPALICYAVAGLYKKNSPFTGAQWLPLLKNAPTGRGYWLIFQDLNTGEVVKGV